MRISGKQEEDVTQENFDQHDRPSTSRIARALRRSKLRFGKLSAVAALATLAFASQAACAGEPQSIAVPSYFYPGSLWTKMENANPTVRLAVMNPNSGPGDAQNQDYVNQVNKSQSAGLTVLGYVHTSYGARDIAAVKAEVDRYYEWYGVDGIFLDEASTNCDLATTYYAELYDHIKSKGGQAMIVHNPGTHPEKECYMPVADVLVTFEGTHSTYVNNYSAPAWESAYPANRFWHLVYDSPGSKAMERDIRLSKERGAGYVYVTPDVLPNPWDTLPGSFYWNNELAAVQGP